MTTKLPPVPTENRSPKGKGKRAAQKPDPSRRKKFGNPEKKGQSANSRQNTHHQGYQQDR